MKVSLNFSSANAVPEQQMGNKPNLALLGVSTGVTGYALAEAFTKIDVVDAAKKGADATEKALKYATTKNIVAGAILGTAIALTHGFLSKDNTNRRKFTDINPAETALISGALTFGFAEKLSKSKILETAKNNLDNIAKTAKNTTIRNAIIAGIVALGLGAIHKFSKDSQ